MMAASLARALRGLGHEVEVISTAGSTGAGEWEGIRVWRVAPWNVPRTNRLTRAAWHAVDLWNPSVFGPVSEALAQARPDVVNTHNIDGFSPAVWQAARKHTRAIVHTLHDYHLVCPRATMRRAGGRACERLCRFCSLYAQYNALFQKNVRTLVAPSRAVAEMHREAGWTGPALEIVRNAVDVPAIELPTLPAAEPLRVLFLSRLEREKGCETLLSAIPRCSGLEFHVAGRGPYQDRFQTANVRWHGFVTGSAKHELLKSSDVFLQISECRENAPLGAIEAKRYGLYVLGTKIGGIPELIDGDRDGRLIPPASAEALCAALADLSRSKQDIRSGRRERMQRSEGYGTREMAEEYVRVFRSAF